jgi:hypothetical protein
MAKTARKWMDNTVPASCSRCGSRASHGKRRRQLQLELLESRDLPSLVAYPTLIPVHDSGGVTQPRSLRSRKQRREFKALSGTERISRDRLERLDREGRGGSNEWANVLAAGGAPLTNW